MSLHGLDAIHFELTADAPRSSTGASPEWTDMFFVARGTDLVALAFTTDPSNAAAARTIADNAIASLRLAGSHASGFGPPRPPPSDAKYAWIVLESMAGMLAKVSLLPGIALFLWWYGRRRTREALAAAARDAGTDETSNH